MIRRSLIILSLCSAVLCAFIGFLSYRAIEESKQLQSSSIELSCSDLLKTAPETSTGVQLNDFVLGRHVAGIDLDGDQQWDQGAIPLFPKQRQPFKYGYRAVILCFKGLPDEAAVDQALIGSAVEADFWPGRQELDPAIYSRLAVKYRHMDFDNSRVLFLGFEKANPVLGKTSLRLATLVGAGSVVLALITFILGMLSAILKKAASRRPKKQPQPTANRAGLPASGEEPEFTGGVLDRVKSMRDRSPA